MKTQAIHLTKVGKHPQLKLVDIELPTLKQDEVLIEQYAIGVNFKDHYIFSGLYPTQIPCIPGIEGAGKIIKIGTHVKNFNINDRVCYVTMSGGYTKHMIIKEQNVVSLPNTFSYDVAASILLKGLTVEFLFNQCIQLKKHHTILYNAATGATGMIACQWARSIGCKIIGCVSTPQQAVIAAAMGCDHVINYAKQNITEQVMYITNGHGVDVVYDSIGEDTYQDNLNCLKKRGVFINFGQSSGFIKSFDYKDLIPKSLTFSHPMLLDYIDNHTALCSQAHSLFELIHSGKINPPPVKKFPLSEVKQAHAYLLDRKRIGSIILIP